MALKRCYSEKWLGGGGYASDKNGGLRDSAKMGYFKSKEGWDIQL